MRNLIFAACYGALTLMLSNCGWFGQDLAPLEDGYHYLFDNESLNGWHRIGGEATFTVTDKQIVGRHGDGENTFLRTDRSFSNFILKLDVKFAEPGNSGIMFRAQQRPNQGRAYGYQYELDPSERAWSGGIYDEARRGWLADLTQNDAARAALKLNDWNAVVIEARGPRIRTWINGVAAADIVDGLDREGYIALQVHQGDAGVIHWRNIRIQELTAPYWDDSDLLSTSAWKAGLGTTLQTSDRTLLASSSENTNVVLTTRRALADFALQFSLQSCAPDTLISMRGTQGGQLRIRSNQADLKLADDANWSDPVELAASDSHRINISALGKLITVNIDEKTIGTLVTGEAADRGKLTVSALPCAGSALAVIEPSWADLKEKPAAPLFYQTLATPPAPVLNPTEALASFSLAPGFEIELVAAEPLVEDPVAMSWDADGNLYVVEMRGFMPDAYGDGQELPVGRVVFLQDTNADGQMDTSQVYLDKLVLPRAVAVVNEGVLIAEPPNLWLCRDPRDDHTCSEKIRVGDYASSSEGNLEHQENALMTGLDNWLYNATSNRRMRLQNGQMISQPSLFRGQWGMTQDNEGRLFYNHNSRFIMGDMFPAQYHLADPAGETAAGLGISVSTQNEATEEVFSVRVNPGVNRAHLDGTLKADGRLAEPTAVSGLAYYRGQQFPADYHHDIFVPEPAANVVAQFRSQETGAMISARHLTYPDPHWGQREFLASTDERFRPVDVKVGPDGGLYVIDMYRGIVQEQTYMTDELREQVFARDLDTPVGLGRIWRIKHSASAINYQTAKLAKATTADLVQALSSTSGWTRDTAQRLLLPRKDATQALQKLIAAANLPAATHALWILETQGQLDQTILRTALQQTSPQLQLQALRAGIKVLSLADLQQFSANIDSLSLPLTQQLIYNLARYSADPGVQQTLIQLLQLHPQPMISDAVLAASNGHEIALLDELLAEPAWADASAAKTEFLQRLSYRAYLSLRGNFTLTDPAPAGLTQLLDRIGSQSGPQQWRQIAMLEGLRRCVSLPDFAPAQLPLAPAVFTATASDENSPLWAARLQGRRAFTWPGDEIALGLSPLNASQLTQLARGKQLYTHCAACHGNDGQGIDGLAPPLADSPQVTGPAEWLAQIVLHGLNGPLEIAGVTWNGVMPAHANMQGFDDEAVAGLLTHIRRSWGNRADPVAPQLVQATRAGGKPDNSPWTLAELQTVPYVTGLEKFVGKYKLSFVTITMQIENHKLRMEVPMYGSGELSQIDDIRFRGAAAGESVNLEFELAHNGEPTALILLRNGERLRFQRLM